MRPRGTVLLAALAVLAGCSHGDGDTWSFERMLVQPRADAYSASRVFADGKTMRVPPQGTVPRGREESWELREGAPGGAYREHVPLTVDRALLERGRDRFDVFCAPCHGVAGDGVSMVAMAMRLRKPPSLVVAPAADFPVGRIYQAIALGYGLMPSYADELDARDRWAVAAYTLALRRAGSARLADLPDDVRQRLAGEGGAHP